MATTQTLFTLLYAFAAAVFGILAFRDYRTQGTTSSVAATPESKRPPTLRRQFALVLGVQSLVCVLLVLLISVTGSVALASLLFVTSFVAASVWRGVLLRVLELHTRGSQQTPA